MSQRSNYLWFKVNGLVDDLLNGTDEYDPFTIAEVRAAFEHEIEQWEADEDETQPPS